LAYRPFTSTDAAVAEPGEVEIDVNGGEVAKRYKAVDRM
jgi:hypothetical protein